MTNPDQTIRITPTSPPAWICPDCRAAYPSPGLCVGWTLLSVHPPAQLVKADHDSSPDRNDSGDAFLEASQKAAFSPIVGPDRYASSISVECDVCGCGWRRCDVDECPNCRANRLEQRLRDQDDPPRRDTPTMQDCNGHP